VGGNIIETDGLTKRYGSHTVVDKLNLNIPRGEIFGLLGPNGAGKSTTILMMLGLTEPDSGSVRVCGIDATSNPIEVKKRVGYLPEDVGFYEDMTGLENLAFTARLNGIPKQEAISKAEQLGMRIGLSKDMNKKAGKYSRGMRQRLGLADVLIKNPEVIILDEPVLGIDPQGVREFLEQIVNLSREEGITVLMSSHLLHQVQQVCDRVGIFVEGRLLAEGNIRDLSQKLFAGNPFTIEAGIARHEVRTAGQKGDHDMTGWLNGILQGINGIVSVRRKNNNFLIECSADVTQDIARRVIESGGELNYLNKKEYGLDEIYYRYFEGGTENV
jgi:ABC-2 type transport system ATP-binding protein